MDISQRFLFEASDIRGDIVQLKQSYRDLVTNHDYPAEVQHLLGEFVAAGLLLGSTIKFEGRLILQVRSQGSIPLLMVEVTHKQTFRGIARITDTSEFVGQGFKELFAAGSLVVTIDPDEGERYQSLVPMDGANLAACLMYYFEQSEQLATWLLLTADDHGAAGFLLQQLPKQLVQDEKQRELEWQHVRVMGEALQTDELRTLSVEQILNRLYHDQQVRLLVEHAVAYTCSCSRARMASALVSLGEAELNELFSEQPEVELTCEFCNNQFSFDRAGIYAAINP